MTSLIDVIFLLLLFFMLSSTFTRFAEIPLASASEGAGTPEVAPLFIALGAEAINVNGAATSLGGLDRDVRAASDGEARAIVSVRPGVTAQRLTDLLVGLRGIEGLSVQVLVPS